MVKNRYFQGSKGNTAVDLILIVVILIAFAIASIFSYQLLSDVNDAIMDEPGMTPEAQAVTDDLTTSYPSIFDGVFLMAFVLFVIFGVISVFMLDTHPVFFVIFIIVLIIGLGVILLLGNAYDSLMGEADISSFANQFTYIGWIMHNIGKIFLGMAIMIIMILFIRWKS